MAQSIGQVTKTGARYRGFVRTALVKGSLEIIPNGAKTEGTRQPDYILTFGDRKRARAGTLKKSLTWPIAR